MADTIRKARALLRLRTTVMLATLAMLASGLTVAVASSPAHAAFAAMRWPTSGTVTSLFNWRCPGSDNHPAIDIANAAGTPVKAAYRGRVAFAGVSGGYGNLVIIDHIEGYRTFYAHLRSIRYGVGRVVTRGERIGTMGSTGNSTGPHLHFEVRRFGDPKNKFGSKSCGEHVTAGNRIRAKFPDLPA